MWNKQTLSFQQELNLCKMHGNQQEQHVNNRATPEFKKFDAFYFGRAHLRAHFLLKSSDGQNWNWFFSLNISHHDNINK